MMENDQIPKRLLTLSAARSTDRPASIGSTEVSSLADGQAVNGHDLTSVMELLQKLAAQNGKKAAGS